MVNDKDEEWCLAGHKMKPGCSNRSEFQPCVECGTLSQYMYCSASCKADYYKKLRDIKHPRGIAAFYTILAMGLTKKHEQN